MVYFCGRCGKTGPKQSISDHTPHCKGNRVPCASKWKAFVCETEGCERSFSSRIWLSQHLRNCNRLSNSMVPGRSIRVHFWFSQAREHKRSRIHDKILSRSSYSSCLFHARYLISRQGYDLNAIREYTNFNLKCNCNNQWSNGTPWTQAHSDGDENVGLNGGNRECMQAPEGRIPDPNIANQSVASDGSRSPTPDVDLGRLHPIGEGGNNPTLENSDTDSEEEVNTTAELYPTHTTLPKQEYFVDTEEAKQYQIDKVFNSYVVAQGNQEDFEIGTGTIIEDLKEMALRMKDKTPNERNVGAARARRTKPGVQGRCMIEGAEPV